MMSPYRRNILVGLTVIVGLTGLSIMLLKFGGTSVEMLRRGNQVQVQFIGDRADGLAEGAQVVYRGVPVGRVASVRRDGNNIDVIVSALVAGDLPANISGSIKTVSLVSGISEVELRLDGGPDAKPLGILKDGQSLPAKYVGADLIPPEILDQFAAVGTLIKGLNGYVNDPAIRQDLQASLANVHQITNRLQQFSEGLPRIQQDAAATLTEAHNTVITARADLDRTTRQIEDIKLQTAKVLDNVQAITDKVNKGQGSAGLLLNDPKLYESLVDNSRQLNLTIADLKRLVEQWEQEGVSFKLK
jgi:phospholipid/cholesterol/gamma-HCH transport system substrate-binding protein